MARLDQYVEDLKCHEYIATSLQLISQQKWLQTSLHDVLFKEMDTRSGDEIAVDIITRAGLNFGD